MAISEQAVETDKTNSESKETSAKPSGWKAFNMRAVVAATEDLLHFILSKKGSRVRVLLIRDIIRAADTFLEEEVVSCFSGENLRTSSLDPEVSLYMLFLWVNFPTFQHFYKLNLIFTVLQLYPNLFKLVANSSFLDFCTDLEMRFRHFLITKLKID